MNDKVPTRHFDVKMVLVIVYMEKQRRVNIKSQQLGSVTIQTMVCVNKYLPNMFSQKTFRGHYLDISVCMSTFNSNVNIKMQACLYSGVSRRYDICNDSASKLSELHSVVLTSITV